MGGGGGGGRSERLDRGGGMSLEEEGIRGFMGLPLHRALAFYRLPVLAYLHRYLTPTDSDLGSSMTPIPRRWFLIHQKVLPRIT